MTIGTVPAAGMGPKRDLGTRRLNPGRRPHEGTALNDPERFTVCSRPRRCHVHRRRCPCTARTGFPRRMPLVPCAFLAPNTPVGLSAALPLMPMSARRVCRRSGH